METSSSHLQKIKNTLASEGMLGVVRRGAHRVLGPMRLLMDQALTMLFSRLATRRFHKLHYYSFFTDMVHRNKDIRWLGVTISKTPLDAWIYQEIIWERKPDVIIETGTDRGGSALFFSSLFDLMGSGEVITVDITDYSKNVTHPRLTKILGSSVDPRIIEQLKEKIRGKKVMVVLDSDHRKNHVLKEIALYKDLVTKGQYMVVEDTNINGHPVLPGWGAGPMEAVKNFMRRPNDFQIDASREKFGVTFYPKGFLEKIR